MAENADDFVAGWVSGVAGLAVTQPVDYALTRLQSGGQVTHAADPNAKGFRGLVAMWRGFMPLAATVPVNNAMLMYGYGVGKSYAERDHEAKGGVKGESSIAPIFLGGCVGGFVQSFLQAPVELIKVRLQLAAVGETPSTSALTMELLRGEGGGAAAAAGTAAASARPSGGFSMPPLLRLGLTATLLRDVLPHGVWFMSYEQSKRFFEKRAVAADPDAAAAATAKGEDVPLSTAAQLAAGSYAAFAAWVVGYPADLLKTRCQMEGGPATLREAAAIVHAEGGIAAFYEGLGLKLLRAVPMSAVGFFVYEWSMKMLARRHDRGSAGSM